jgi:hypothetical protein
VVEEIAAVAGWGGRFPDRGMVQNGRRKLAGTERVIKIQRKRVPEPG